MSEQGHRRTLLLALTGVTTVTLFYLAYTRYTQPSPTTLHRSNAVRRSRGRWRRGFAPQELNYNPTAEAIKSLKRRISAGSAYGRYENTLQFPEIEDGLVSGQFDLLPETIPRIFDTLLRSRTLSEHDRQLLRFDIEAIFLQKFLAEEYPAGYKILENVEDLVAEFRSYGLHEETIRLMVHRFDHGKPLTPDRHLIFIDQSMSEAVEGAVEPGRARDMIEALAGPVDDDRASLMYDDSEDEAGGSQNMLNLLYHIAGESARREGYIHRGVECNSCGTCPIQGIRYHCANCFDFDLCERCEASQVHHKAHVFYKIRIPAPSRGHIKQVAPVWYPGNPNALPGSIPKDLCKRLVDETGTDKTEMEALYEQFKCLAGHSVSTEYDPAHLGLGIDRKGFDLYFTPTRADRPPPQSLIYDRAFAFYDQNNDGLITFDEFVIGVSNLLDKTRGARLKRIFTGYDLDSDGFVDRKDFLRMFRAFYALSKELNREMISMQDDLDEDIREAISGMQPISAAFGGSMFAGHVSRGGQDKEVGANGDLIITEGPSGVLVNESEVRGDRSQAIANASIGNTQTPDHRSFRRDPETDEPILFMPSYYQARDRYFGEPTDEDLVGPDPTLQVYGWPPSTPPEPEDVIAALGVNIPLEEVTDPIDRSRIVYAQSQRLDDKYDQCIDGLKKAAVEERWKRRQFYLDEEEGMTRPPGYTEPDSSDDGDHDTPDSEHAAPQTSASSRRQSMRSRSSSKVRFDDSALDTDFETRSNTSSRSIPVNERWGGFELSEPEKDIGKEILYQAIQQGFNELLDPLFREKEDEAMESFTTQSLRMKWVAELDMYEASLKKKSNDKAEALRLADLERTEALMSGGTITSDENHDVKAVNGLASAELTSTTDQEPERKSSYDEQDHIQIMFGGQQSDNNQASHITPVVPILQVTEEDVVVNPTESQLDLTLPQYRPNDASFPAPSSTPGMSNKNNTRLGADGHSRTSSQPQPEASSSAPPSKATLKLWLRHRKIDNEAVIRGGYGKLSYREFKRKIAEESGFLDSVRKEMLRKKRERKRRALDNNNDGDVDGGDTANDESENDKKNQGADNLDNLDNDDDDDNESEDEEDEEEEMWNETADLGKLSFVGAWLEMAQF